MIGLGILIEKFQQWNMYSNSVDWSWSLSDHQLNQQSHFHKETLNIKQSLKMWKRFIGYKTLPCKIMVSHRKVNQIWFNNYTNIKIGSNLFTHEHRTLKWTLISSTFLFAIGHSVEPFILKHNCHRPLNWNFFKCSWWLMHIMFNACNSIVFTSKETMKT
jgi:hypothetical protein